jgi:lipopolysaccharide biosynthesis glycosyltransferase
MQNSRTVNFMDQDALNAVLVDKWKALDYRWNIIASIAGRAFYRGRGLDRSRLEAAIRNPGIVHYAGYLKPWRYSKLASRWQQSYIDVLLDVFPNYTFPSSLKSTSISFYDRYLRNSLYTFEQLVWSKLKILYSQ